MTGLTRIAAIALLFSWTTSASAEVSSETACEYFAQGNFEAKNGVEYEAQGSYQFGSASLIKTSIERYQTWFWKDVSVALFQSATNTKPTTFLSSTMTCFVDIKNRRVLQISIQPGLRIGEKVDLPDGDYKFMIEPKVVHVVIGEHVHKGKY